MPFRHVLSHAHPRPSRRGDDIPSRNDDVTQPNAACRRSAGRRAPGPDPLAGAVGGGGAGDGRGGRRPRRASRPGRCATRPRACSRTASAIVAAAMDHLQLALDEPPAATFRPVLRALRLHAIEAGSPWTAIDLLDVEMAAAGTVAAKAELAVQKAGLLENRLGARERARAVIEEALALVPGPHRGAAGPGGERDPGRRRGAAAVGARSPAGRGGLGGRARAAAVPAGAARRGATRTDAPRRWTCGCGRSTRTRARARRRWRAPGPGGWRRASARTRRWRGPSSWRRRRRPDPSGRPGWAWRRRWRGTGWARRRARWR